MRSLPISTPTPIASDVEIDFLQLLGTLRRGKWRIIVYTFLTTALGLYYALWMTTPVYTAVAHVALNHRSSDVVDLASPLAALDGSDYFAINTEVETLQSRDLAKKLAQDLSLIEDPIFNATLQPPTDNSFSMRALIGQALNLIRPEGDTPAKVINPPTEEDIFEDVVDTVMGSLEASNINDSYVFEISATTTTPEASQRLANGMASAYIENQIAIKYEATEQATIWLNTRVAELEAELEAAENAVKAFNAKTDLVGPETLEALNRQLKDRRDRVDAAEIRTKQLKVQVTKLRAVSETKNRAEMATLTNDLALKQLLPRLGDVGAPEAFDKRFGQLLDRAELEATRSQEQSEALSASVVDLESQVKRQSSELLKLEQLDREASASRQIYEYFLGRLKETAVQQGVHQADSRILSRAVLPKYPSAPRKSAIVFLAALAGFSIGCALVLIQEMRQTGFRSASELEQASGITVFAQIPKAPFTNRKRILSYLVNKPTSAMVEAVRNLRTSIILSNMDVLPP